MKILSLKNIAKGIITLTLGVGIQTQVSGQTFQAVDDITPARVINFGAQAFNPIENDKIPSGKDVIFTKVKDTKFGPTSFNVGDNQLTYNPSDNTFEGRDTLVYKICYTDEPTTCSQAQVIFGYGKIPFKPTANDDSLKMAQNTTGTSTVITNDIQTTAGKMQVAIINGNAKNGNATVSNNQIVYTPNNNFVGLDTVYYALTDTFTFKQVGRVNMSDTAKVIFRVNSKHTFSGPAREVDTLFLPQASIMSADLTSLYADLENDKLSVSNYIPGTEWVVNPFTNILKFTPQTGFTGSKTLKFDVCDALNQCVKDSITYFVKQAPVIPNPILLTKVYKDTIKFGETGKITILKNDSRSLIIPVSGFSGFAPFTSVTNNSTTADVLTFDVKTSATRTSKDTFNLKVCLVSDLNKCSNAQVIMLYLDTAKKPVAKDDYKEIKEGTSVTIEVLKNDVLHGSSIIGSTPAKNGNAVFNGNVLTYTPNTSYYGKDSLTYTICRDSCTTATVRFDITPVFYAKVVQAVSPNGDNINDVFTIEDVDYQLLDISVKIYNRWGTLVFSEKKYDANNPDKSWHGQGVDRDDLVDGTYFYVVDIPALDFKEEDYLVLIK